MDHETNFPPDANPILDRLLEDYAALRERAAELMAGFEKVPATIDLISIDRATAFVKQVRACAQEAEEARTSEGREFLTAKRTVDAFFMTMTKRLAEVSAEVERRMLDFLNGTGKVRGALGGTATVTSRLAGKVLDTQEAMVHLWPYLDEDAVQKALRGYIRAHRDLITRSIDEGGPQPVPGIRFFYESKARVV